MLEKIQSSHLHPGPGFRIRRRVDRVPGGLAARFAEFDVPDVSDALNRLYTMDHGIRLLAGPARLVGPACTIKVFPGDNLMVHKALDLVEAGDVMVVDGGGSPMNALMGDLIATKARTRGIAGMVLDGLVRDLPGLQEVGLPVFARGVTPIGPLHRGPGEINFPVSCGGIVVNPGDLVCADGNGVVIVRREFAADTLHQLETRRDALREYIANVRRGVFSNTWVDQILAQYTGLEVDDDG